MTNYKSAENPEENIKIKIRALNEVISGQNIHYAHTVNFHQVN